MSQKLSNLLQRTAIVVAWLVIWQIAASIIDNGFLLCGPVEAVLALIEAAQKFWFWESIAWSFVRIGIGFVAAFVLGCIFGVIASAHIVVARFLSPAINVVKSAPVVCIIAILLVIFGSQATTSIVVAMVVFPPIYAAVIEGSLSRDASLDEMAHVFGVSGIRRVLFIDFEQYAPFLRAALKVAIAMSWKAGVAAELIGLPGSSIGEAVYLSKLTLDVAMIVAWTAVVILIGWLCEKVFLALFDCIAQLPGKALDREVGRARMLLEQPSKQPGERPGERQCEDGSLVDACGICADGCVDACVCPDKCTGIKVEALCKSFGEQSVFSALSLEVAPGEHVCIMAPSGAGKTTLLKMMAHLESKDAGILDADGEVSFVFQDDRLVKNYSAAQNLALSANDTGELAFSLTLLEHLIPDRASWEGKAAKDLSGGMKRRVEIARALAHRSCVVLMDEPFSGLDVELKQVCASVILESLGGRACVVATHDESDAALLDARVVRLDGAL